MVKCVCDSHRTERSTGTELAFVFLVAQLHTVAMNKGRGVCTVTSAYRHWNQSIVMQKLWSDSEATAAFDVTTASRAKAKFIHADCCIGVSGYAARKQQQELNIGSYQLWTWFILKT